MQVLASEVKTNVMPIAENAKAILAELKPKVTTPAANVSETTNMVRDQIERVEAAVAEVAARTHLQVIRAQELFDRTEDHIDETSELIHRAISPVRRLTAVLQGVTAGLGFLIHPKRRPGQRSY